MIFKKNIKGDNGFWDLIEKKKWMEVSVILFNIFNGEVLGKYFK